VLQLDAYLTSENAAGLLAAAAGKTRLELEEMLATRFPRTELLALVAAEPSVAPREELVPERSAASAPAVPKALSAPARITPPQRPTPIAQDRYAIQFSTGRSLHDKLQHAQELMGCTDLELVFEAALDSHIEKLEKRKFGAGSKPRKSSPQASANPRHIPTAVKHAVWQRDHGRAHS
jgi:hypothetical protein